VKKLEIRQVVGGTTMSNGYQWSCMLECDFCRKTFHKIFMIEIWNNKTTTNMYICQACLKSLREQIDALRILILTGEDTK
jgi:hypothetical protein